MPPSTMAEFVQRRTKIAKMLPNESLPEDLRHSSRPKSSALTDVDWRVAAALLQGFVTRGKETVAKCNEFALLAVRRSELFEEGDGSGLETAYKDAIKIWNEGRLKEGFLAMGKIGLV